MGLGHPCSCPLNGSGHRGHTEEMDVSLVHRIRGERPPSHPHGAQFNRPAPDNPLSSHRVAEPKAGPMEQEKNKTHSLSLMPLPPNSLKGQQTPSCPCSSRHSIKPKLVAGAPRLLTSGPFYLLYPLLKCSSLDPHRTSSATSVPSSEMPP